jgi:hypothetical protein
MGRTTVTRLLGQLLYLVLEKQLLYGKLKRIPFMV